MKLIFIGDIYGKIGRRAVAAILPQWKKKYKPDFVIANGENLAHGCGISEKTIKEIFDAGIDALTGGNHIFSGQGKALLNKESERIVRPANYPQGNIGRGQTILQSPDGKLRLLVVNLIGRVFFHDQYDDPFRKLDEILGQYDERNIFVDFHAEATSEVNALGHYADGRISALVGTHTHIGTIDARVLAGGTAYVTDVGAVAAVDSVLGENKKSIIQSFLLQQPFKHEPVETGLCAINAVLITIDPKTGKARGIKRIDEEMVIN